LKKKNSKIGTPHFDESPSCSLSVFEHVSSLDEGKDEQVTSDTGEPLRFESPTLKRLALPSYCSRAPAECQDLSGICDSAAPESGGSRSLKTREALIDTEAEQPSNEPAPNSSPRFKGTSCVGDEVVTLPAGIVHGTASPLMFTPFALRLENVDGVFQGPCLFSEDAEDSDGC
jgi:hypothetical protein